MKTKITYYINVDYMDGDQSTYNGLELSITYLKTNRVDKLSFNSGDISIDYIDLYKYLINDDFELISGTSSSSLDHFSMDGEDYVWKILDGWEQIVPKYIKTIEDMQRYYKEKKQLYK